MKKLYLFILFFINFFSFAQTSDEIKLCFAIQGNSFSSDRSADIALNKILSVTGLSKRFVLAPCSEISNCLAISYKGIRYILFDKNFMDQISSKGNDWANLSILAHEVGHHINGHSIDVLMYSEDQVDRPDLESLRQMELEADEFSGFVMAKLGASIEQASQAMNVMATEEDDTYSTHPKKSRRLKAIQTGYDNAGGRVPDQYKPDKSKISVEEIFNIAESKQTSKDYIGAINEYSKALNMKPDYTYAYNNRGFLKYQLKDYNGAISDYSKVIDIDPAYPIAYYNRALAKKNLKDYYGALNDYNNAIKLRPDYAIAYNNRGNIKFNLKDYRGAIMDYTNAIRFKSKGPVKIFTNRGVSKELLGDLKGACSDWKVAARLGGKNAQKWLLEQCN
ncbi:MAG: tetratricopeptide repeat protein [Flavobacteriaceae bacterium]|nr:tetratricopeptide repeat protein [Flavobacteriaceae bacterium]